MTKAKPVHQLLNLSKEEYDQDVIQRYMRYCENLAKNHNLPLQSCLANSAINSYYNAQFMELEYSFLSVANRIANSVDYTVLRTIYATSMTQLYAAYPGALIQPARNLKIENPPYAN